MTAENPADEGPWHGPACPHCRGPLRGNLRQEQVTPLGAADPGPRPAMTLTYCGSCGQTLHLDPARADLPDGPGLALYQEVAAPADEQTPEGQFQLRSRELIGEIRSMGFDPNVWVAMIGSLGAAGAARKLLADHHMLVVTPWLVRRGRPELTLEHQIGQPQWSGLFTDEERAEAARRLARAGRAPRRRRGLLGLRRRPGRTIASQAGLGPGSRGLPRPREAGAPSRHRFLSGKRFPLGKRPREGTARSGGCRARGPPCP